MSPAATSVAEDLVVGAGPAGSTAALLLARAGRDVLLVEQRRAGQGKVCGEFVSAEGVAVLRRLGVLEALLARGALPITRTRLQSVSGDNFDTALPECAGQSGLGVSRNLLDETLLAAAERAGARVLRGARLIGLRSEGDRWQSRVLVEGVASRVTTPRIVGADGRNSRVAVLAGVSGSFTSPGIGVQLHLRRRDAPPDRVELLLLREGYAGLAPVEADRWCLAALLPLSATTQDPFHRLRSSLAAHPRIAGLLEDPGNLLGQCAAYPVRLGLRGRTPRGLILAGDAAGFLDPFSGQGIAMALLGGEAAAGAALHSSPSECMRSYGRFLSHELSPRMAVAASLRHFLAHPGWSDHLVRIFRRHPGLGRRVVGLTRIAGSPAIGSLQRLAGRLLSP